MKFYVPTYEECVEIVDSNPDMYFYERKYVVDGYRISIFGYRLARYNNFMMPLVDKPNINALELKGMSFVFDDDGTVYNHNIMLNKFWEIDQYNHSNYKLFENKNIKNITIKEDGFLISFIKLPNGYIISQTKHGFDNNENIQSNKFLENKNYYKFINYCLDNDIRPIFEYVGAKLKINYDNKDLILIKLRDNKTGEYLDINDFDTTGISKVEGIKSTLDDLLYMKDKVKDQEGWVVHFDDDDIIKVKTKWWKESTNIKPKSNTHRIKYYDCSINETSNSNHNIQSLGPVENDIMVDLEKYAHMFGFERVYNYEEAELFVTNTIYPDNILKWSYKMNIPKIKRMDGIFWHDKDLHRNDELNKAAMESNHVIFISDFSLQSLEKLYGISPKNYTVILNNADDTIFRNRGTINKKFTWVTSATNWIRGEKRLNDLIKFSEIVDDNDIIRLIGECDLDLPKNIIKEGYINNKKDMSKIIGSSDAFLSLFFRCAGSKVTCQAIQSKLPVLYAKSGGLPEIVGTNGIPIDDYSDIDFLKHTPNLDVKELKNRYHQFKYYYDDMVNNYRKREPYLDTISRYFEVFKLYV